MAMTERFASRCPPQGTLRLVVLGATGRLGGMLRAAWGARMPAGLVPLWQTRRAPPDAGPGGGWLEWDPLAGPPPAGLAADVVLSLAGVTRGTPEELASNAALARAAVAAARAAGARHLLLASSAAVYGPGPEDAAEDRPPAPVSAYGRAKLAAERAAAAAAAGGGPGLTCLRPGNVAGADALLGRAAAGQEIVLDRFAGGMGPLRSYIGPGGLAQVLAGLARQAGDGGQGGAPLPGVLNLAAPGPVAMEALLAAAGLAWRWRAAPPGAVARLTLDVARLAARVPLPAPGAAAVVADWRAAGAPAWPAPPEAGR